MKKYFREVAIICIILVVAIFFITHFINRINEEKTAGQIDLYTLTAASPEALIRINRPSLFTRIFLASPEINEILGKHFPEIYLSILRRSPSNQPVLFSFHPQGVVMYTKASKAQTKRLENDLLVPFFHTSMRQRQQKEHIHFTYFPDKGNRFFGYYQHEGILVASYSKKLLEEVAQKQAEQNTSFAPDLKEVAADQDPNTPMNLIIPSTLLNTYIQTNDSTRWKMDRRPWLSADLYISEGSLCFSSSYSDTNLPDSLYTALGDTLSLRLNQWEPSLNTLFQLHQEDGQIHFTGCSPLSVPTSYLPR